MTTSAHPQIANRMGIRCRYSLSDLLAGNIAINSVCVPTEIPNLYVFDSGNRRISNPVEVLSSIRYKEVLNELYDAFDFLIIDTPPVGLFVDAAVISSQVEGVLVVVQKGKTKREAVRAAMSQLEKANAHVLGAVLNGASHTSSDYYYYHYGSHRRRRARAPRGGKGRPRDMTDLHSHILFGVDDGARNPPGIHRDAPARRAGGRDLHRRNPARAPSRHGHAARPQGVPRTAALCQGYGHRDAARL